MYNGKTPILFVDIDGVLTCGQKIYYEKDKEPDYTPLPYIPPTTILPDPPLPPQEIRITCDTDNLNDGYDYNEHLRGTDGWEDDHPFITNATNIYDNNISLSIPQLEVLKVAKQFSDKDSYIIQRSKRLNNCRIILISKDNRVNQAWAERQGVEFIHCPPDVDKIEEVRKILRANNRGIYDYYYVGDAMPDFYCLRDAKQGFVPKDASPLLKMNLISSHCKFTETPVNGGEGVLDWVYCRMVLANIIKDDEV